MNICYNEISFNFSINIKWIYLFLQISNLAFKAASAASLAALFSSVLRYYGIRPVPDGKSYEPGPGWNVFLMTVSFF